MPIRVQLKRIKGWRMPRNTVSVARPSRYGNPFIVGIDGDAVECVELYKRCFLPSVFVPGGRRDDERRKQLSELRENLRGKNLACWCELDQPCHADVLLELVNP